MRVAIATETSPGERRVAATPETVRAMTGAGLDVAIQAGAGDQVGISDHNYRIAGATVLTSVPADTVDVLLHVGPLHPIVPTLLRAGSVTVGFLDPLLHPETVAALARHDVTSYDVAQIPASLRNRPVDVVGGQHVTVGYRAALTALQYSAVLPGNVVTAAGVHPAAKVLVVGADVVGIQAAATARQLGARVTLFDPNVFGDRDARAVGAISIEAVRGEREQTMRERLSPYVADADIVIATPLVKVAPVGDGRLEQHPFTINDTMLDAMKPGAVVLEALAGSAHTVAGIAEGAFSRRVHGGGELTLVGLVGAEQAAALTASRLLSQSMWAFLKHLLSGDKLRELPKTDPLRYACITHRGQILDAQARVLASEYMPAEAPVSASNDAEVAADAADTSDTIHDAVDVAAHDTETASARGAS